MARAVSTVLDVSVCLLLVGVAVTTLVAAVPDAGDEPQVDGDPTANSLGTVTASVPAAENRRVHDTLAGHLTAAAIANGSVDGDPLGSSTYPESVRRAVREHVPHRTHITARWRPYPNAPVRGQLVVGPEPPSTADVAATRWTLDSDISAPKSVVSFEAIVTPIASAYVDRVFPPERTRIALVDPRTAAKTADRYRTFAGPLGVDIDAEIANASSSRANDRLASALAERLEDDLDETYASPAGASNDVTPGDVEIVVRRWEP